MNTDDLHQHRRDSIRYSLYLFRSTLIVIRDTVLDRIAPWSTDSTTSRVSTWEFIHIYHEHRADGALLKLGIG